MDNKQMIPINEDSFIYKIKKFFRSFIDIIRNKTKDKTSNDLNINNIDNKGNNNNNINNINNQDEAELEINNTILATPETLKDRISNGIDNSFDSNLIDPENVEIKKREFVEQFDNDIEKLRLLSVDRLIKLEEYYDSIIKENQTIIESYN